MRRYFEFGEAKKSLITIWVVLTYLWVSYQQILLTLTPLSKQRKLEKIKKAEHEDVKKRRHEGEHKEYMAKKKEQKKAKYRLQQSQMNKKVKK